MADRGLGSSTDFVHGASASLLRAQGPEARANLLREDLGLFPRGEVATLVDLVVVDELGIRLLRPAPRERIELVRENAHGNRDSYSPDAEEPFLVLPVEAARRNGGVRQPGERDVVEDVVSREAGTLTCEDARDQPVAALVVVEEIGRQPDRRIRQAVHGLRAQPKLEPIADPLLVDELQALESDLLIGR